MKIEISRREDNSEEFDMILESGHFRGLLEHISEKNLMKLEKNISDVRTRKKSKSTIMIWNPRSKRHEVIESEENE